MSKQLKLSLIVTAGVFLVRNDLAQYKIIIPRQFLFQQYKLMRFQSANGSLQNKRVFV